MAGRGADEGRRKLPGSGPGSGPVRARKHGPGDKKAARGAPQGDTLAARARLAEARLRAEAGERKWLRLAALHALAFLFVRCGG